MAGAIVECVPNFSEGRDPRTVDGIVGAIAATPGVLVLGRESDPDHNRSVVTFAGPPRAVLGAALRAITKAVELIDISKHTGVHPRIGAADVVPLVPVREVTLDECAALARELGEEVWRLLRVPVYFYEAAARTDDRRRLESIRRGGLQWLREHVTERRPDIGDKLHPTAGAVVIGARRFLVAFNVNLATGDVEIARSIARSIRESAGGMPGLKAMGVLLDSRGLAQVSMNLTDLDRTGIGQAFEAVADAARRRGVGIAGSEIVGLAPRRAIENALADLIQCENFGPDRVLEDRIEVLSAARSFDPLLDQISSPTSAMGGGSAAACAGALAASLGLMVARLAKVDGAHFVEFREFFAGAVERDADAFNQVLLAQSSPAGGRGQEIEQAYRRAAIVPAELAERAKELDGLLLALKDLASPKLHSDVMTAIGLSRAARAGGIAAAKANLVFIQDEAFRQEIEHRLDRRPSPSGSQPGATIW